MVSILAKARRSSRLLFLLIVVCLCISVVHGQEDSTVEGSNPDPSTEESEGSPSSPPPTSLSPHQPPITTPPLSPSPAPATPPGTTPGNQPSSPGTPAPPAPATPAAPGTPGKPFQPPNPIFSTSDACVACQKEFPTIRNCTAMLPPPSVNLTIISQILPFYKCICQNDSNGNEGGEIAALQQCSSCFRSTGQRAFLSDQFYNVTNQQLKAMKQVCDETEGGTRLPTSGAGTGTRGLILQTSTGWYFVLALVSALLLVPGWP